MNRKTRRQFMKELAAAGAAATLPGCGSALSPVGSQRIETGPESLQLSGGREKSAVGRVTGSRQNVIFISVDDLNDWISPLGGYAKQVLTPNLERLAARSVNFTQAYCAAPYCGASRSATMTGIAPWKSQIMHQANILEEEGTVKNRLGISQLQTIPRYFKQQGYKTLGGGKLYHGGFGHTRGDWLKFDKNAWNDYFNFVWSDTNPNYRIVNNDGSLSGMIGSAYDSASQEARMPDKQLAQWAVSKINAHANSSQPLFLGLGFYRPHISWFVPKRFYDMYPLSDIAVPKLLEQLGDLGDLPEFAVKYLSNMSWTAYGEKMPDGSESSDHYSLFNKARANGYNGHVQAIQAYLASVSFADECLGQVLDALEMSGMADNSIIVLWSDHGWSLGEKLGWRKFKLWEKATRVPFMIAAPGAPSGVKTQGVASLLDLFPTLIDLTSGGAQSGIHKQTHGKSLRRIIENPNASWQNSAATSQVVPAAGDAKIYSLRNERYRYIKYPDQAGKLTEELYDLRSDPQEKTNLLYHAPLSYVSLRDQLRKELMAMV